MLSGQLCPTLDHLIWCSSTSLYSAEIPLPAKLKEENKSIFQNKYCESFGKIALDQSSMSPALCLQHLGCYFILLRAV